MSESNLPEWEPEGGCWSLKKAFAAGIAAGAAACFFLCLLYRVDTEAGFEVPLALFLSLFCVCVLIGPATLILLWMQRLERTKVGILYSAAFALGSSLVFQLGQIVEYGIWKGLEPAAPLGEALANSATSFLQVLVPSIGFYVALWLILRLCCRLFTRRRATEFAGHPRCTQCGYDLFGLGSDYCPECGAAVHADAAVARTDP